MRKNRLLRATVLAMACSLSMAVSAQSGAPRAIDIPPGDLVSSLQALTRQSGAEFVYREDLLAGLRTQGVRGTLTAERALEKLLEGSGFAVKRDPSGALMIIKSGTAVPETEPQAVTRSMPTAAQSAEPATQDLEKITVTGTRIRGGVSPSPVITIGSEQIQEEGFADLGEVIRSVPQNFSGGQNPGVALGAETGAGGNANQNITGGSSLNLRGLGPDATLTLLNGRRMAYGGFSQTVDISVIPVEAVERIEIVADGASAIYGSDAVGGVGNVILKRDFDGVALGIRHGTATDGGLTTREYTATGGTTWASGGLITTYKDASTDPIYARQRDYAANHMPEPATIYPGSNLRSGLLSIHQSLGNMAELRLDALRTERDQAFNMTDPTYYHIVTPESSSSLIAPGIEFTLPNDWVLSFMGVRGKDDHLRDRLRAMHGSETLVPIQSDSWHNKTEVYEVSAEGSLFEMGGGDARLAVGAGHRTNEYMQFNRK